MILGIDASRANHEQRTGVESYAFFVIQELKKIDDPRITKVVLYTDRPLRGELADVPSHWSVNVLRWPPRRLWTQFRLSWEMLIHPPDILFIPAHVPPLVHPKKTIMTVHDIAALRFPQSYNWFERWYSLWSARHAVKKLYRIIVPSEFTKKELGECISARTNDKTYVVPHGYTQRNESPDQRPDVLKKYNISGPCILSIGRLEEKKNTKRIIQAFDMVKRQHPDEIHIQKLQLVLVGKPGYGYDQVQAALDASLYRSDIITPGWVEESDVAALLHGAQVFVFSSLYEGFGLPVLEAFAAGIPVIASRGSSLEEVGQGAAVYVDPFSVDQVANAIYVLTSDKSQRDLFIQYGKVRVQNFSWRTCVEQTVDVLLS